MLQEMSLFFPLFFFTHQGQKEQQQPWTHTHTHTHTHTWIAEGKHYPEFTHTLTHSLACYPPLLVLRASP